MSKKSRKQMHKEIYKRCCTNYEYNSDYHPLNEICCDNLGDIYDLYGTIYPKHDKTDYSVYSMRGYTKHDDKAK